VQKRLTAEFGMGSGLIAPQKSPGRRKAENEANWNVRRQIMSGENERFWGLL
jgi:hypothetical protein